MTGMPNASKIAIGFFVTWLGILLAGADFPPPVGFLWIVFLDVIAAALVYVRVPTYLKWLDSRKKGRLLFSLLDGLAIGLVFALTTMLLPGGGEPSLPPPNLLDRLIWCVILGAIGAANAGLVYFITYALKTFGHK